MTDNIFKCMAHPLALSTTKQAAMKAADLMNLQQETIVKGHSKLRFQVE